MADPNHPGVHPTPLTESPFPGFRAEYVVKSSEDNGAWFAEFHCLIKELQICNEVIKELARVAIPSKIIGCGRERIQYIGADDQEYIYYNPLITLASLNIGIKDIIPWLLTASAIAYAHIQMLNTIRQR